MGLFGGLILLPPSCPFSKWATVGLRSIFSRAASHPLWTLAVQCVCEVYNPGGEGKGWRLRAEIETTDHRRQNQIKSWKRKRWNLKCRCRATSCRWWNWRRDGEGSGLRLPLQPAATPAQRQGRAQGVRTNAQ